MASIFQRRHGTNWVFTRNVTAKRLLPRRRRRGSDIRRRGSQELELSASLTTNLSESAPGTTEGKDRIVVAPDGASPVPSNGGKSEHEARRPGSITLAKDERDSRFIPGWSGVPGCCIGRSCNGAARRFSSPRGWSSHGGTTADDRQLRIQWPCPGNQQRQRRRACHRLPGEAAFHGRFGCQEGRSALHPRKAAVSSSRRRPEGGDRAGRGPAREQQYPALARAGALTEKCRYPAGR